MTDLDTALDAITEANAFIVAYFDLPFLGELQDQRENWWTLDEKSGDIEFDDEHWDVKEEEGRYTLHVNSARSAVVREKFSLFHVHDGCGNSFAAIFENAKRIT